jgi:hypothetical protein
MLAMEARPVSIGEKKEAADNCDCCEASTKKPPRFCSDCCFCDGIHDDPRPCCCSVPCYNYAIDLWNGLDLIMIATGIIGLSLHNIAASHLNTFTIHELWGVVMIEQVSHVFLALCAVIAYFRFLHFLIPWEYIGVLVITVFKMMDAIIRFGILFVFIALGFSTAFHLLYDNNPTYSNFLDSSLTTGIGIFSGYDIPDYSNLLSFPSSRAAYFFQIGCVVIGVVLLLNFLIAMMNSVYDDIRENSTQEYRWLMTRELTQVKYSTWPVPFVILQGVMGCGAMCCAIGCNCDIEHERPEQSGCSPEVKNLMYANMAVSYFRETLSETDYKKSLLFDDFNKQEQNNPSII